MHGQPHPLTGSIVVLTTAHVYDDRPEAAGLLNLAALCQRCHNRHDAPGRRAGRRARHVLASGQLELLAPTALRSAIAARGGGNSDP